MANFERKDYLYSLGFCYYYLLFVFLHDKAHIVNITYSQHKNHIFHDKYQNLYSL